MLSVSTPFTQNEFGLEEFRFKELAHAYAEVLKTVGARCIPYTDPSLPLFSRASWATKQNAISFLENALSVFAEIRATGGDIRDSRALVWRTLSRLKLVPDSTIFDKMEDGDVVELYSSPEHFHLAWNILFMDRVSFTAEQLFCLPWWELTSRPIQVTQEFQRLAAQLQANEFTGTIVPNVPRHWVQELNSHELLRLEMDVKYISPLRKNGRNVAFLVIINSKIIGSDGIE